MATRIVIFIPPDVTALDVVGPHQVFQMAGRFTGEKYDFVACGLTRSVPAIGNLQFGNLTPYHRIRIRKEDILIVGGFQGATKPELRIMRRHPAFFEWLRKAWRTGATVCSTCTGSFFLAEAGILDGLPCTTHWADCHDLQQWYPKAVVRHGILFTQEGNVLTSAGVCAGIDMSLHLIAQRHGPKNAFEVARRLVVYLRRSGEEHQDSIYLKYRNHLDDVVHRAQSLLIESLDSPPGLEELAQAVGSSARNLSRRFRRTLGISVGAYLQELRLERARLLLLEQGSKVDDVARACGFNGGRQLRNLYRAHFGHSPRASGAVPEGVKGLRRRGRVARNYRRVA